jgi:hypothetical protein
MFVVETDEPGYGASFNYAGAFNASSATPAVMPQMICSAPRSFFDPLDRLSLRRTRLPTTITFRSKVGRS